VTVAPGSGPLSGIRVVMMAGLGPAPFCATVLADLGADVIRVDRVADVDVTATVDTLMRRSQRSIAVDMKHPRGREVVHALAAGADAFVDPYRPGAAERMGVGPDELLARNPRLVYARMTGWGQDGPYAQMAGHDINYLSLAGALHAIGPADAPVPPLNLLGDYGGGGMLLAVGLLAGLLESRRSGQGQVIDVSMYDGAALLMTVFYGLFAEGQWADRRQSNLLDGAAHFYRTYETADGEHFAVGAMEPQFYAELCTLLDVDVPQSDSVDHWAAHSRLIAERFRTRTRAEWEAVLVTPQSCASPVLGLTEAPDHPHARARGTFVTVDGVVQPAPAPRFSRTPAAPPGSPAMPGDHTDDVLAELGLDTADLAGSGAVRQSHRASPSPAHRLS
jgi:alpha-methylacyl-CoA racemase